ncbi:hypothetical protein NDU88_003294 [Pleurodeles waltl]|uniref:Gypsy retrotransposon integrase-like protein 1 n=1 Tax=Pleurodeles waltl TaxID=8319 RepID=A0AAV7MZR4_PLEWA|nr:hypothetical protein NDU88_003294 [Pleurodeles waltl]
MVDVESNSEGVKSEEEDLEEEVNVCKISEGIVSEEKWRDNLRNNVVLQRVISMVKTEWCEKNRCDDDLQRYWQVQDGLSVVDGLLTRGTKLVPPVNVREELLKHAHASHMGIVKTNERVREGYWCPAMDVKIERMVRECIECSSCDEILKCRTKPMVLREQASGPWSDITIDIVGPEGINSFDRYVLVYLDMFSHWPKVKFVSSVELKVIIEFLEDVFEKEGFPRSILSDNGVQFTSKEVVGFLRERGVKHKKAALYHPESNGIVERFVKVLKESVQQALTSGGNWKVAIRKKVRDYRFTPHSSSGIAPFQLFRGRRANTEMMLLWVSEKRMMVDSYVDEAGDWRVREREKMLRRKELYDVRKMVKDTVVGVEDWVKATLAREKCLTGKRRFENFRKQTTSEGGGGPKT